MARSENPSHTKNKRLVLVMLIIGFLVLIFQSFTLLSRISLSPQFPAFSLPVSKKGRLPGEGITKSVRVGKLSLLSDSRNSSSTTTILKEEEAAEISNMGGETNNGFTINEMDRESKKDYMANEDDDDIDLDEEEDPDSEFSFDLGNGMILKKVRDPVGGFIKLERIIGPKYVASPKKIGEPANGFELVSDGISKSDPTFESKEIKSPDNGSVSSPTASGQVSSSVNGGMQEVLETSSSKHIITEASSLSSSEDQMTSIVPLSGLQATETLLKNDASVLLQSGPTISIKNSRGNSTSIPKRRKKQVMPPISISEMNRLLLRNRATYHSMTPRWSSARDQQLLAAKAQIENAPIVNKDHELYAPAFRNISMFKKSYKLMEGTLKVYVYKEGQKPIFHQPLLKGIYASEGWFMKLMESNRRFVVRDPRKAHMFYMPFSSRFLEFALYVPNSHNRRNLEQYLKDYVNLIAAKHPFWNRTGGADHFLAACHDWAPYETGHAMEHSIRTLCNADLHEGFRLGKDVSLPEIYVRSARNPLRDLGGKPADQRPILAFFAGNMHGRLRPVLLEHWENKDPDMKIFGPMPRGVESKMTYIRYMKTSKYCICPRGYEVNSPRVVESIFYECVPVIISDNYVPPLFEVLNWEAFSVIIPEEDVPRLKEILLSIPREKYLSLQMGVRKVQQHFLWHVKPVKYDAFHMILHSIWFNRVFNIRAR
ncbi:probable glycosyltransferase At5g03795 [Elaeis guineensis]|uniref:Probable glycosyltransferase At5g03795 n=1 Tax=Elaeis guineensis var. tenera TaxID=51953 RepID=A0A6I9RGZ1_ELAGV|nr:probable glycosyltransferase At5g03795 [Elaeis guineensis]